jgi:hypothetical protein
MPRYKSASVRLLALNRPPRRVCVVTHNPDFTLTVTCDCELHDEYRTRYRYTVYGTVPYWCRTIFGGGPSAGLFHYSTTGPCIYSTNQPCLIPMRLLSIEGLPAAAVLVLVGHLSSSLSIDDWQRIVNLVLLPVYTALVIGYITLRVYHVVIEPRLKATTTTTTQGERSLNDIAAAASTFDESEEASAPQPIDMTGVFRLVENHNFEELLAAQGIPWALRSAANRARPTHKFTHKGNLLTIKIQGIIESETKYHIGGAPTETAVRGRQFHDTVTYLEDKTGIQTLKRAVNDGYTVRVCRRLSPDKSTLTMTSTVYFDDESKDAIDCRQLFERIDDQ